MMSAYLEYNNGLHAPTYQYITESGHDGVIQTLSDMTRKHYITARISAMGRLFDNSLIISAYGEMTRNILSGISPMKGTFFSGRANMTYYHKNFSAGLFYKTPNKDFNNLGVNYFTPCSYGIDLSCSLNDFKANILFQNWFSSGYGTSSYDSQHYSFSSREWGLSSSLRINFVLTYTFNYGKKVEHNDYFDTDITRSSSILH